MAKEVVAENTEKKEKWANGKWVNASWVHTGGEKTVRFDVPGKDGVSQIFVNKRFVQTDEKGNARFAIPPGVKNFATVRRPGADKSEVITNVNDLYNELRPIQLREKKEAEKAAPAKEAPPKEAPAKEAPAQEAPVEKKAEKPAKAKATKEKATKEKAPATKSPLKPKTKKATKAKAKEEERGM